MLNSEKFKSVEERRAAYEDYCEECIKKNVAFTDRFGWLELKCKEEKPCPCPFCGDESVTEKLQDKLEKIAENIIKNIKLDTKKFEKMVAEKVAGKVAEKLNK